MPRRSRPPPSRCSSQPRRARNNPRRQPRPPVVQPAATAAAAAAQLQRRTRVYCRAAVAAAAKRAKTRANLVYWLQPCRAQRRPQRIRPGNGSRASTPTPHCTCATKRRKTPALVAFGKHWRLRCARLRRGSTLHCAATAPARTADAPIDVRRRQLPRARAGAPLAPHHARFEAKSQPPGALSRHNARPMQAPGRPRPRSRRPRVHVQARTASVRPFSRRDARSRLRRKQRAVRRANRPLQRKERRVRGHNRLTRRRTAARAGCGAPERSAARSRQPATGQQA